MTHVNIVAYNIYGAIHSVFELECLRNTLDWSDMYMLEIPVTLQGLCVHSCTLNNDTPACRVIAYIYSVT